MFVLAKIVFFLFLIPQLLADDVYVPKTLAEKPPNVALEDSGENWKFVMKNGDVLDCYFILEQTEPVVHFKITRPSQIKNETYFSVFFNTKRFESIEFFHHYENVTVVARIKSILLYKSQNISYEMFFNKNGNFGIRNGQNNGSNFALETQNSNGFTYIPFKLGLTTKNAADFLEFFFKKGTLGFAQTLKPQPTTPPTEKADAALIGGIVGGVIVLIVVVAGGLGVYFYRRKQKKPSLEEDKEAQKITDKKGDEQKVPVVESAKGESDAESKKKEPKENESKEPTIKKEESKEKEKNGEECKKNVPEAKKPVVFEKGKLPEKTVAAAVPTIKFEQPKPIQNQAPLQTNVQANANAPVAKKAPSTQGGVATARPTVEKTQVIEFGPSLMKDTGMNIDPVQPTQTNETANQTQAGSDPTQANTRANESAENTNGMQYQSAHQSIPKSDYQSAAANLPKP